MKPDGTDPLAAFYRTIRQDGPRPWVFWSRACCLFWPFIVVILIVGLLSFFAVQTAQVAVITRFGKFRRVAEPGLNWKWPFIDRVAGRVSLRVNQITLTMETQDQGQRLRHHSDFGAEPRPS